MSILPYCMMPDGGDPCKGYAALKAERDRLTIIADAIQAERDRLSEHINGWIKQAANMEAERDRLRAALEEIASYGENEFDGDYVAIARRALEGK